ncbi:acyl-CoA dehydrogenase [Aliikangiella coralliicola]|uniref:Acyl-coenzyme A dehydrogenase n=1 Tax=Aliikangiella coralliicola TaxID=2592383 RepID=A0A545U0G6_9GAMM|nr:acyl-CoA dehydrogenase [Aliikangiella coralliicola]TQV82913.1 acyl-CoA dehydrogenase [Aliikangiella coralliicola]
MVILTQILVLIGVIWASAYMRARMGTALTVAGAALVLLTMFGEFKVIPWLLFGAVALLYFADDLRKDKITRPIFKMFRSVLPPMNQTEREALEAGDVWWDGELFKGNPNWKEMLAYEKPELTEEEQSFVDNQVETVCNMVSDWDINFKDKDLPQEAWDYLKKEGFWGLIIPKEYGGKGFSALAHSTIVSKLSTRSGVLGVTTMVPNSLGPAELLLHYGTEEQKNFYLPRLAKGDEIPCFALTAPKAGSDAGAIPDTGIICKGEHEGEEVLGIRLNWNKRYITLAPVATVLGLAFKMYDPDGLIGDKEDIGITVALIPTSHPGVEIGERHYPMGQAFMNGPTRGKDVFIPLSWIVGGQDYAGKGWRMLVECLSAGRGISLPSSSTATGKLAYRATGAYSVLREQFKTEIGKFEGVEEALARIAGSTYQLEATRLMTAGAVDAGVKPSVVTAIAKYHMTEAARDILKDSMDVHGGRGVIMGERNYLSSGYMSMPISITVEGANILTRNLMIFGQGAVRCHPFVFREMQAAANPNEQQGVEDFDSLFFRHIGYGLSNFIRSISMGLTSGRIVKKPVPGPTGRYYQQLTRMSSALALVSDLSMAVLGGELKRKERLSARLGDVLSYLYLSSAVLKYYEDSGRQESDLPYVEWNLKNNLHLMQKAFLEFFENLRPAWLGKVLRRVVFPYGIWYKKPSDYLDHTIVKSMFNHNELRDRLTCNIFVGDENDPVGRIENAFNKVLATKSVAQKIKKAVKEGKLAPARELEETVATALAAGILSQQEADDYLESEALRLDAIQVDEYSKEYIAGQFEEGLKSAPERAA